MGFFRDLLSSLASATESTDTAGAGGDWGSESKFEQAVNDVVSSSWGISHATVTGPTSVSVSFYSQSRRTTWDAHLEFDPVSWTASGTATYLNSGKPHFFAEAVRDRMLST